MPIYESESLVLKSHNLAEADRIVVFFTKTHGVVRGVAKGAKRLNSRFGSLLEPFTIVNLEYFEKEDRELVSMRNVDLVRSFFAEASDPAVLHSYSYIADLVIAFVPPRDANEKLYRMIKACVMSGGRATVELAAIRLYFELWLLRLGGYLPDWSLCDECKAPFAPGESANVKADFHLLCDRCRKVRSNTVLSSSDLETFQAALKLSPRDYLQFASEKREELAAVSTILKRIIASVLGREVAGENTFAIHF
ncbi:MAG: DNA repair protein RecO [Sporichthyaceae bacterium]